MAEYSKLATGSFTAATSNQVVYLPFIPSYVKVTNENGNNSGSSSTGAVLSIEWFNSMNQGDGILTLKATTTSQYTSSAAPNGVTTFSTKPAFSFGSQIQVSGITKANPAVVTTGAAHGYNTGDVVMFEGLLQSPSTGMQQFSGMPFFITVTGSTTFTINWNTNQSNYTALTGSPAGAYVKKLNYPFLYEPGVSFISSITPGATTTITTTAPHCLVQGQEVAFRIPSQWGMPQLNSLPNAVIPGSPVYGYVTSVPSSLSFVVNTNSLAYTAFNSNPIYTPGLSFPQAVAVGSVNAGGVQYSGTDLYPSPQFLLGSSNTAYTSTINGPAVQGAFVNNTYMGFTVGSSLLTPGIIGSPFSWTAMGPDVSYNEVIGITVS